MGPGVADYSPFVRITDVLPNGSSSVVFEGQVAGQRCTRAVITPPLGTETIRADYLVVGITGQPQIVNTAQVSFQVRDRPLVTPSPPPPSLTATPLPTATPTPKPTPPASEPVVSAPSPFFIVHTTACGEWGAVIVELGWSEAIGADAYSIYRDREFIGSEGPGTLGFIDPLAPNSATVIYEVVASNSVGAQTAEPNLLLVETPSCVLPDGDGLN